MNDLQWALNESIPFGKYRGEKLSKIYSDDHAYILWLIETVDRKEFMRLGEALDIIEANET